MSDLQIGLMSIFGILFLIYAGMHVAIALTLLSFLGVWFIRGKWIIASKLLALAAAAVVCGTTESIAETGNQARNFFSVGIDPGEGFRNSCYPGRSNT